MSVENAPEKASSSTDADGKEFSCPVCERSFGSKKGLNSHRGHAHPETTRVIVPCDYCGSDIEMINSNAEAYNNHFCDRECKYNHRSNSTKWSGENHPNYNSVKVDCAYCETTLTRNRCRVDEYNHQYCDTECYHNHVIETGSFSGENNPAYNSTTLECVQCGDEFTVPVSKAKLGQKCCGEACAYEYKSEKYSGENNWRYNGYSEKTYGNNWQKIRAKVRERDGYNCQYCGSSESDLGKQLDVHHIIPLRKFDSPEQANKKSNLVCLCRSCHQKWEGVCLRPDVR